jgi:nitrate reductase NapD
VAHRVSSSVIQRISIVNISSAIVHAHTADTAGVRERLMQLAGVEVHGISAQGKMIVTIESVDDDSTIDTYTRITQLEGVLAAAMVYSQSESEPEKEISNDIDSA